jgi:hypothetical protein
VGDRRSGSTSQPLNRRAGRSVRVDRADDEARDWMRQHFFCGASIASIYTVTCCLPPS